MERDDHKLIVSRQSLCPNRTVRVQPYLGRGTVGSCNLNSLCPAIVTGLQIVFYRFTLSKTAETLSLNACLQRRSGSVSRSCAQV